MQRIYRCLNLDLKQKFSDKYTKCHQKKEIFYLYVLTRIRDKLLQKDIDKYGYVSLNSNEMRDIIPNFHINLLSTPKSEKEPKHGIEIIREDLKEWGVIDYFPYSPHGERVYKAAKYKLLDDYKYNYEEIDPNDYHQEYVTRLILKGRFTPNNIKGIHKELYELQKTFKLDVDAAKSWVKNKYTRGEFLKPKFKNGKKRKRKMDQKRMDKYLYLIDNFDNHYFKVSKRCGRSFSNLVGFPKVLRQFIYIENELGDPTYFKGLDVKSAQPLILGILLKEKYEKESELLSEENSEYFSEKISEIIPEDVRQYISLNEEGIFYDYLMELFTSKNIEFDEEVVKTQLFSRIFYNKERDNYKFKMRRSFDEVFPNVSKYITEVKSEKDDHSLLPISLQLKESEIMRGIWKRLRKLGIPFFPVHDCVYVPDDRSILAVVRKIMIEEFELYGVTPTIHLE